MVEISEIVDEDGLRAWLADKQPSIGAAIASRAAMRVWPLLLGNKLFEKSPTGLILVAPRAVLNSTVAIVRPTDELKNAAHTAHTANTAANTAARAANAAANAFAAADAAAYATRVAAYAAMLLPPMPPVLPVPLMPPPMPSMPLSVSPRYGMIALLL